MPDTTTKRAGGGDLFRRVLTAIENATGHECDGTFRWAQELGAAIDVDQSATVSDGLKQIQEEASRRLQAAPPLEPTSGNLIAARRVVEEALQTFKRRALEGEIVRLINKDGTQVSDSDLRMTGAGTLRDDATVFVLAQLVLDLRVDAFPNLLSRHDVATARSAIEAFQSHFGEYIQFLVRNIERSSIKAVWFATDSDHAQTKINALEALHWRACLLRARRAVTDGAAAVLMEEPVWQEDTPLFKELPNDLLASARHLNEITG